MAIARRFVSRRTVLSVVLLLLVFFLLKLYVDSSSGVGKAVHLDALGRRKLVDLVVVEEHHEVLDYWFDAANKGIIPKSGNVLVHIDAHSDMAPPELVENYPFFSWPKSKKEVKAMMQSNDVFIQGAAMSGLFKKIVWVWPSWDEQTHEKDDITRLFGGGWTEITVDGEKEKTFCECEFEEDGVTKKHCLYLNRTAMVVDDYDGTEINVKSCNILGKVEYQELVDYNALHQLRAGKLVKKGESLLLDIDQDFFGCVLRGQDLVDAGMDWNQVEELDEMLSEIFCPKVTRHEGLANELLQNILRLIITICKDTKSGSKNCLTSQNHVSKKFKSSYHRVVDAVVDNDMFCDSNKRERENKLGIFVESLFTLNVPQLKAIAGIGFCMQTSPRSYDDPGFQICHGANEPNTSVVTVHMPPENELRLRLERLERIVQTKSYPTPGMVTLCRSVRDGYAPVPYFTQIEQSIIASVKASRPGVRYNVIYDKNLLAGKKGWPARQKHNYLTNSAKKHQRKIRMSTFRTN